MVTFRVCYQVRGSLVRLVADVLAINAGAARETIRDAMTPIYGAVTVHYAVAI